MIIISDYDLKDNMGSDPIMKSIRYMYGALDGGSRCRMSILRNGNVACLIRLFMPMAHVEFKK